VVWILIINRIAMPTPESTPSRVRGTFYASHESRAKPRFSVLISIKRDETVKFPDSQRATVGGDERARTTRSCCTPRTRMVIRRAENPLQHLVAHPHARPCRGAAGELQRRRHRAVAVMMARLYGIMPLAMEQIAPSGLMNRNDTN
jgi:hypothetical protein